MAEMISRAHQTYSLSLATQEDCVPNILRSSAETT